MAGARGSFVATALVLAVAACDQGSWVSVRNDSDQMYVALVGDEFLAVPPNQHVTVAMVGFTGSRLPEIQLLDADCAPVGKPRHDGGTFTIKDSGQVLFDFEITGEPKVTAEATGLCADRPPAASSTPSPVASDPGPS
jgi:hypothetical protein